MIRIYGGSDDITVVAGDVSEELGEGVPITIGWPEAEPGRDAQGVQVVMVYDSLPGRYGGDASVWSAIVRQLDEDAGIPWPVRVTAKGYSAVVEVDCPPGTPVRAAGKVLSR